MRKSTMAIFGIALFSFAIGIYFYPQLPEEMASHWNAQGEADAHMPKFWGLFLFPSVLVGLSLLFIAIPVIDPLKENIEKFRGYYDGFVVLFFLFMLSVYFQMILWNLGMEISPNLTLPIGLGLLFFYIGILCENAKRNWFIGIRTPWTLSSERVWEKTHKIGGKLFKIAGAIAFAGLLFRSHALFLALVPAILAAAYAVVYSYIEYQKEAQI